MTSIAANRLALSCAYSAQAPEWAQFVRLATPVIALAAHRVGRVWGDCSSSTVSEIVQEVFLKLCEDDRSILRKFEDRGPDSLLKYVRVIAATVASDHFRFSRAQRRMGDALVLEQHATQEHISLREATESASEAIEWPTLMAQLDGLLRRYPETVSSRDRTLFWLYYRQGLTAEAIARIPSIRLTQKGVESALLRLTRLLRAAIAKSDSPDKSKAKISIRKLPADTIRKGFSSAVAIDHVERR